MPNKLFDTYSFVSSAGGPRSKINFSKSYKDLKNDFLKKNNLKIVLGDAGLDALNKIKSDLVIDLLFGAGKVGHGFIDLGVRSILNSVSSNVPFTEKLDSFSSENSMTTKYIQNFTCGKISSQSIKQAAKQNGTEKINLYDSISDSFKASRKDLNFSYGFNQKKYIFLGKYSHVSLKDYWDIYKLENFVFPKFSLKTPYGLTLTEHVKLKLLNHNRYNAINFNLHIVCLTNPTMTMEELAKGTFNVTSVLQDEGSIPNIYQYSDIKNTRTKTEVICNVTTSLLSSSFFKNNCKIVKSFKKRLNPGDIYEFLYKYRCGSGVRLDLLYERTNPIKSSDQPSTYGFIIETLGYDCEAIDLEDESMRYVGKSPGFFNMEIRKDLEVCTKSQTVGTNGNFDLEYDEKEYLIKVFTKNLKKEKDFNFDHVELDKKYKIITYSVQNIRSAGETHFNSSDNLSNSNETIFRDDKKKLINIDDLED